MSLYFHNIPRFTEGTLISLLLINRCSLFFAWVGGGGGGRRASITLMGDLGCQNIKTRTQRNLVVFHLNLILISSILNYSFYFFDLLLELFDVNETVCILLIVQIWRGVEGPRLECHFAEFWAAKQMAGSFSGTAT